MLLLRSVSLLALMLMIVDVCICFEDVGEESFELHREKRQVTRRVSISAEFEPRTRAATLILTTSPVVSEFNTGLVLNSPDIQIDNIAIDDIIQFGSDSIIITVNDTFGTILTRGGITTFVYVDSFLNVRQIQPGTILDNFIEEGLLYSVGGAAVLAEGNIVSTIEGYRSRLPAFIVPPDPVTVLVVTRDQSGREYIALNIDTDSVDNVADIADDRLELTNSRTLIIRRGQSVSYDGSDVLVRTRSRIDETITDIDAFGVLQQIQQNNFVGRQFVQYDTLSPLTQPVGGPGILRVGTNLGVSTAIFSSLEDVNGMIERSLVDLQVGYRATTGGGAEVYALFPSDINGDQLIQLMGAQNFRYPNAQRISVSGTTVSISDESSREIQRIDTGTNLQVYGYIRNEIVRIPDGSNLEIFEGVGASIYFNPSESQLFVYPLNNELIENNISMIIEETGVRGLYPSARYTLEANQFGIVTLIAILTDPSMDVEVVEVSPASIYDVNAAQTVEYNGNTIRILNRDGTSAFTLDSISTFGVNIDQTFATSGDSFPFRFTGPGRIYVDRNNNAFYTTSINLQNSISNFVSGLPEPLINVIGTRRVDRPGTDVTFNLGQISLFTLNGGSSRMVSGSATTIYSGNSLHFVNAYRVPMNTRVIYNASENAVEVIPLGSTEVIFTVPASTFGTYINGGLDFLITDQIFTSTDNDNVIYYGPTGALYADTNRYDSNLDAFVTADGGIGVIETISGISMMTVSNGRNVISYNMSSPVIFPNGGSVYISANGMNGFYSNNPQFSTQVITSTYSQLNPVISTYDNLTNTIIVTTSEDQEVVRVSPSEAEQVIIDRGTTISYFNSTITFSPEVHSIVTNVTSFIYYNGLDIVSITSGTFTGPGYLVIEDGMAFFTNDTVTSFIVTQSINTIVSSFVAPEIIRETRTFTSKFQTVLGAFPQRITLYEGANLSLACNVRDASPPVLTENITFFRREETQPNTFMFLPITLDDPNLNYRFEEIPRGRKLHVDDITQITNENSTQLFFKCRVRNFAGSDELITVVEILERVQPAIVAGYVPPRSDYLNSSTERIIPVAPLVLVRGIPQVPTYSRRNIIVRGSSASPVSDEGSRYILVTRLHIGCKAEGRPKATIRWFTSPSRIIQRFLLTPVEDISFAGRNVDVTVPREGRSVLSIDVRDNLGLCEIFVCSGTNDGINEVFGSVEVCQEFYDCELPLVAEGACSVTCGVGLQRFVLSSCSRTLSNNVNVPIDFDDVPFGLFDSELRLCFQPSCPVVTYNFTFELTECSTTCGEDGIIMPINVLCVRLEDGVIVNTTDDLTDCTDFGLREPVAECCETQQPCPFWSAGEFSACSGFCSAPGIQPVRTREVMCVQYEFNITSDGTLNISREGNLTTFPDMSCENGTISRPLDTIPCNRHIPCPFRWVGGPFGDCDRFFCQERNVTCELYRLDDVLWPGQQVNSSFCSNLPIIHPVRSCGAGVCSFGRWTTVFTSACSVTCGEGRREQNVFCVDPNGFEIHPGYCDYWEKPRTVVTCVESNCPGQCNTEPKSCPLIAKMLGGCKDDRFASILSSCCISCPYATLPTLDPLLIG